MWSAGGAGIEDSLVEQNTGTNIISILGDGASNASQLQFNCSNNNHNVNIIGPDHINSPLSYSLKLPNKIAEQSAYVTGGRILESNASGELQWITTPASGGSGDIAGTIEANQIPVGTATDTIDASIMTQDVASPSPTYHRIKVSSPTALPSLGKFPSIQLYNGSNGTWATGAILSEIQTFSNDPSQHICSFINTVQGTVSSSAAISDGELVFGTAPYNKPVGGSIGAQESMRIDKDGSVLVKQVGISTDDNYRTGNVSVQNTGEFRLYGSNPFTASNYHSIRNNNGALEIGDQTGFSGSINFFVDQASALEINDSAESTFKQKVTVSAGDLTVSSGSVIASPNGDFKTSGGGFFGGDGTAAKPTFAFDSDNDTGIYRFSSNTIGMSAGGTSVAKVLSTGLTMVNGKQITLASNSTDPQLVIANQVPNSNTTQKSIKWSAMAAAQQFAEFIYQPAGSSPYVTGSIQMQGIVGTLYASGSDYRLKENIVSLTGAVDKVKQLKPKTYNFLSDPDKESVDGFIAHEAQEVVPNSVAGEKDKIDENGDAVYQMMDPAKLVPILTGAIQELTARIEALEAK
jgi:hypothetical protein